MAAGVPASSAQVGNDWYFLRGDGGSPEVFTEVPEVIGVTPGSPEVADTDVTHLRSDGGETKPGKQRPGNFVVTTNYVPGNAIHNAIEDEAPSQTYRNYRLMDPTNTFGFLYKLAIGSVGRGPWEVDGRPVLTFTYKQSGKPTRIGAA